MSIELEVGQVWGSNYYTEEVLKIHDGMVYTFDRDTATGECGSDEHEIKYFLENNTLITTADGKPYVPANDYQVGQVWEGVFNDGDEEHRCLYFIYESHGWGLSYICEDGSKGPITGNFIDDPQDYIRMHFDSRQQGGHQ